MEKRKGKIRFRPDPYFIHFPGGCVRTAYVEQGFFYIVSFKAYLRKQGVKETLFRAATFHAYVVKHLLQNVPAHVVVSGMTVGQRLEYTVYAEFRPVSVQIEMFQRKLRVTDKIMVSPIKRRGI